MSSSDPSQRSGGALLLTAGIAILLFLPGFIERVVMDASFQFLSYDNDTGWFSIGLARLSGHPLTDFHHPSFFFNVLSGGLVSLVTLDGTEKAVVQYARISFALQALVTVAASYGVARLSRALDLGWGATLALVAATASFPTAVIFSAHYSNYFMLILLALGIGLLIHGWIERRDWAMAPLGLLVGFQIANFFPALAVLATIVIALVADALFSRAASPAPLRRVFTQHPALLAAAAATGVALTFRLPLIANTNAGVLAGLAFAAAFTVAVVLATAWVGWLAEARSPGVWRFFSALLAGFWIGASVLAPYYLTSLGWRIAEVVKALIFEGILLRKLQETPIVWAGVIPVIGIAVTVGLLLLRGGPRVRLWVGRIVIAMGCAAPLALMAVLRAKLIGIPWLWIGFAPFAAYLVAARHMVAANGVAGEAAPLRAALIFGVGAPLCMAVALLYGTSNPEPGVGLRLMSAYVALVVAAIAGLSIELRNRQAPLRIAAVGLAVLAALSVGFTLRSAAHSLADNRAIGEALDRRIATFMAEKPNGLVLCARDESFTRVCTAAYAYNQYRSPESRAAMPTKRLFGGRVLWISIEEMAEPLEKHLDGFTGPVLVVGYKQRMIDSHNPALANRPEYAANDDFVAFEMQADHGVLR